MFGSFVSRVVALALVGCGAAGTPEGVAVAERGRAPVAELVLIHHDRMGDTYRLARLVYALDGEVVCDLWIPEHTRVAPLTSIARVRVARGGHRLDVALVYRGHGYGLFEYLKLYRFRASGSLDFVVDGDWHAIEVGGVEGTAPVLDERPQVRFDEHASVDGAPAPVRDRLADRATPPCS